MERNIAYIALFAALIAALGLIGKFNLIAGVPITAQSMGVMLAGTVLGAKRGFLAVLLFVGLTLIGLPLLSGGRGGLGLLSGPSVGFIIGFPIAAYVTGFLTERLNIGSITISATIAACIGGILVLYIFGVIGMAVILDKSLPQAAALVLAFIPGDAVKAVVTGVITGAIFKARPDAVFSRA